jgi:RecB family endonuclease NucS
MYPFSMYKSREMEAAFAKLGSYKPPSRKKVGGSLSDTLKQEVRQRVRNEIWKPGDTINIVADGSTNINGNCIQNVSLVTMDGLSFHWNSIDIKDIQETAEEVTKVIMDQIVNMTDGDFSRVNSFASDTCNTMKATWECISRDPRLKEAFMVPCDSHGIQLAVKDILKLDEAASVFAQGNIIVEKFHKAPLQLSRLRVIIKREYEKEQSLLGSIMTR